MYVGHNVHLVKKKNCIQYLYLSGSKQWVSSGVTFILFLYMCFPNFPFCVSFQVSWLSMCDWPLFSLVPCFLPFSCAYMPLFPFCLHHLWVAFQHFLFSNPCVLTQFFPCDLFSLFWYLCIFPTFCWFWPSPVFGLPFSLVDLYFCLSWLPFCVPTLDCLIIGFLTPAGPSLSVWTWQC